ncbi:hypothetical protein BDP27DRAFT_1362243 [Rhodocollybia butyracea]|uniref:Uncharacterized protein n=1 Tax=Rhodocollybia butyracea TaxID=206335 RepID=A0A9P5PWY2_9AGAR|nr:hypothetical protein BDP27DRAFT_1362243 [Rhodocollybia butyracea]
MVESHVAQFGGDIGEKQNAVDFERSFLRAMRASGVDKKDFVSEFQLYLTHGSPADNWYTAAAAAANDWDAFVAVFRIKFPAPKAKLLERHPDTNNYMWKWYADKLYHYAKLANIENGCSSIISVRDVLPPSLRVKVSDEQANWKDFTDAIKAVKKQEIEEGTERQKLRWQQFRRGYGNASPLCQRHHPKLWATLLQVWVLGMAPEVAMEEATVGDMLAELGAVTEVREVDLDRGSAHHLPRNK